MTHLNQAATFCLLKDSHLFLKVLLIVALLCGAVICQRGEEDDCRVVNDKDGAKYGSCSRNMVRVSDSSEVLQTAKRIAGALSASVSRSVDLSI